MWNLPTELLRPLEKALARVEAAFRDATQKPERPTWPAINKAITSALLDSLKAYDEQAYPAVQQDRLTVSKAREGAEDFLTAQAQRLFDWLVPIMDRVYGSPFRFRRYESEDRFVFSRDTVEEVQSSEQWGAFLRRLAEEPAIAPLQTPDADATSNPDGATPETHDRALPLPSLPMPSLPTADDANTPAEQPSQADTAPTGQRPPAAARSMPEDHADPRPDDPPSIAGRLDTKEGRKAAVKDCREACGAAKGWIHLPPANWVWKAAGYIDRSAYHDWINTGKNSARFQYVLGLPPEEVIKRVMAWHPKSN